MSSTGIEFSEAELSVLCSCVDKLVACAEKSGEFDAAELRALWNLEAHFEKKASGIVFARDYELRLASYKKELLGS